MSKKLKEMKWQTVALEGFPASVTQSLDGFVGLEECTSYELDKEPRRPKKKKLEKKRKSSSSPAVKEVPNKKTKLSNGFVVENCNVVTPSNTTEENDVKSDENLGKKSKRAKQRARDKVAKQKKLKRAEKAKKNGEYDSIVETKKKKPSKLGADISQKECNLTPEDMLTWAEFQLPEPILKAMAELGFKQPTKIQQLSLPAAIHGRRDILGAAETGSGKTLAFGLPILTGIMDLKEKAALGQDVHNLPYKKLSNKKKEKNTGERKKKREPSVDEGNDSDDENYIHLSDMLDSDDLKDSSSGEENEENDDSIGCVKVIDNIEMPTSAVHTGKPLYALILTPTRELAIQISRHLIAVAKYTGIRIATIVGGMAAVKQERVLKSRPEIVVATPGRLWELISTGHQHLQQLDSIKFLAIDETDRMVERSHFEELTPILERINADPERAAARQNFVFSATLTMVHELPSHMLGKKVTKRGKIINRKVEKMTAKQKLNKLVKKIGMTEPKVVDITEQNLGTAETLTESRVACSADSKDAHLYYILKRHPGRTIVFCNSISCVRRLAQLLTILKCHPLPLHAGMQQRQRLKNLEKFRDNPRGILVSTDVAARGLDIPDVDHVIHYQVPKTAENYVHRSGRTARANKEGLTILMMEPAEAYLYTKLCRTLNKTSEVPSFPIPLSALAPFKDIVSKAREIDALELKRRRTAAAVGWREKVAKDMDILLDDDDVPTAQVDTSIDKALKVKRRELDKLLQRPMFPKGFSFKYPTLNDPSALIWSDDNALQVMKKSLDSGELKREKRKSKNAPLLKLQKQLLKKSSNK
ncbi:DEAD/DEAH box helicase domain-containing protein [Phthorimaea operculella]|nr:DEAD/DEAH box helicase domain-containing protein [Phthorimaea operculella]